MGHRGQPPGVDATAPVWNSTIDEIRRARERADCAIGVVLVHDDGIELRALAPGEAVTVGRTAPSDVRIPDTTLSRVHARLTLRPEGVVVEDAQSTNGCWIDDRRVKVATLGVGDSIMLGGVLARVRALGDDPAEGAGDDAGDGAGGDEPILAGATLQPVLDTARRVADSRVPVILRGETGVGKELLARFVHDHSPRGDGPMVSVNCGSLPAELVESTLFGHERGAFTGAHKTQPGVFEAADGGSVFLDEIGELPLAAQVSLLRVLETGRVTRVGTTEERAVDVRIIAATHRDLERMIEDGGFRADLFYRLDTVTIEIPPLRARTDEIEPLAERFVRVANRTHDRQVIGVTAGALALLGAYEWPGNVRELRNVIERAVVIAPGDEVTPAELPARVRQPGAPRTPRIDTAPVFVMPAGSDGPARPEVEAGDDDYDDDDDDAEQLGDASGAGRSLRERMQEYEAQVILDALHKTRWNRGEAARLLDMPLRTLAHKIKVLGLSKPD